MTQSTPSLASLQAEARRLQQENEILRQQVADQETAYARLLEEVQTYQAQFQELERTVKQTHRYWIPNATPAANIKNALVCLKWNGGGWRSARSEWNRFCEAQFNEARAELAKLRAWYLHSKRKRHELASHLQAALHRIDLLQNLPQSICDPDDEGKSPEQVAAQFPYATEFSLCGHPKACLIQNEFHQDECSLCRREATMALYHKEWKKTRAVGMLLSHPDQGLSQGKFLLVRLQSHLEAALEAQTTVTDPAQLTVSKEMLRVVLWYDALCQRLRDAKGIRAHKRKPKPVGKETV